MNRILLIVNSSQNIYNFRIPLIRLLEKRGFEVETISFDDNYVELLEKENIVNNCIHAKNRSLNVIQSFQITNRITKIIKRFRPNIVFTFMAKPNIFGVKAARRAGVKNIFSMVEGAGDPFCGQGLKWKLIKKAECILYKKSFKFVKKVFFLNKDDASEFERLKLVRSTQSVVINGIGVDLDRFAFKPLDLGSNTFLMISRMLKTKGVFEYCKCANLVKRAHPEAEFLYLGREGTVKKKDIQSYIKNGDINYLGNVSDVRPYIEKSLMVLLPSSYREGKPMSLMESQSMGRGIITTDNVGCRDMVINGYNGFLVKKNDYRTLAEKCISVLNNKSFARQLGRNAREFAENNYNQKTINEVVLRVIESSV